MSYRILSIGDSTDAHQSWLSLPRKLLQFSVNATNTTAPTSQPAPSTTQPSLRAGGTSGTTPMSSMRSQSPENLWGVVIIALSLVLVLSGIASCCTKLLRWRRQRVQELERERHGARKDNEPLPGRLTTWEQLAALNKSHRGVLRHPLKNDGSLPRKPQQQMSTAAAPTSQKALRHSPPPQAAPAPVLQHALPAPATQQDPQQLPAPREVQESVTEDDLLATTTLPLPPDPQPAAPVATREDTADPSVPRSAADVRWHICSSDDHVPPQSLPSQQQQQQEAVMPTADSPSALTGAAGVSEVTAAPPPSLEGPTSAAVDEQDAGLCSICLEDYSCSDMMRVLPCGHFFHQECVDTWMDTQAMVCPLCRTDLRVESPRKVPLRHRLRCPSCFRGTREAPADADFPAAIMFPASIQNMAAQPPPIRATHAAGPAAQTARTTADGLPV